MAGKKDTICWGCEKARGNGCSWFRFHKPVDGWVAVRTLVAGMRLPDDTFQQIPSFRVDGCPEFVSDVHKYAKPIKGKLPKGVDPCSLRALRCNGQKVALN